jgi:hypothetical protein
LTWVRIDDRYPTHPKMLRAGPLAIALDVAGMCYCADHATDGFIPTEALPAAAPFLSKRQLSTALDGLVAVGRWFPAEGGWLIHDFLDYNPSAADAAADRDKRAEATRKWRARRRGDVSRGDDRDVSPSDSGDGPVMRPRPLRGLEKPKGQASLTPPARDPSPDPTPAASPAGSSQAAADLAAESQNNGQPPTDAQRAALRAALERNSRAALERRRQDADAEEVTEP